MACVEVSPGEGSGRGVCRRDGRVPSDFKLCSWPHARALAGRRRSRLCRQTPAASEAARRLLAATGRLFCVALCGTLRSRRPSRPAPLLAAGAASLPSAGAVRAGARRGRAEQPRGSSRSGRCASVGAAPPRAALRPVQPPLPSAVSRRSFPPSFPRGAARAGSGRRSAHPARCGPPLSAALCVSRPCKEKQAAAALG